MSNDSIRKLWAAYRNITPDAPETYEAWAFGDSKEMADELATLVLTGQKTATTSNYTLYELEDEALPYVGLHNIILDGNENAVAIVETTAVHVVPFHEVTSEHAYLEGEGDRTLTHWRNVHQPFFAKELAEVNQTFDENIPVVCEQFKLKPISGNNL